MNKNDLTWIEIDSKALKNNIRTIKNLAEKRLVGAALKANAYGHGLEEMVTALMKFSDFEYIALHSAAEAERARMAGWDRRILIVGYISRNYLSAVIDLDLEPTVYNLETIKRLGQLANKAKRKVDIHLKIETGTNRQGIDAANLGKFADIINLSKNIRLKGISTHFANIEDTTNHAYADNQLKKFRKIVAEARHLGLKPKLTHTACSAALLLFEKTKLDMVRPGIALYGLWPSKETYLSYRLMGGQNGILSPVLSWKTKVAQIKDVPAHSFIGYGCTYKTTSASRLAVIPVGYFDGYDRSLSNLAYVLIRGERAPIRGRICMNLMMADITSIKGVRLEDEVVLIGKSGKEILSADQLALWAGTVNYEILSRINEKIPKMVV